MVFFFPLTEDVNKVRGEAGCRGDHGLSEPRRQQGLAHKTRLKCLKTIKKEKRVRQKWSLTAAQPW